MKTILKKIFSLKTAHIIGDFLAATFKWANISYKAAMWTFAIITTLIGIGLYGSIISLINLQGFVILPLIGAIIKLALFLGSIFGWAQFWLATRILRKGNNIKEKAETVYKFGKITANYGKEKLERNTGKSEGRSNEPRIKSPGKKYF